jgi:Holliday junction resolvase RusA-like endonuclease
MEISFFVPGEPTALKRHRMFRRGKFLGSYDPSKGDKADFLAKAMQYRSDKPFEGAISLMCSFYFSRPKSHYKGGKYCDILKSGAGKWKVSRPDLDNLEKFILDSLNGVYFKDDRQVVSMASQKQYCDTEHPAPGAQITIEEIF